ncbi:MAG: methyltransferase domain-containing protein [Alphaproteobacteria bacterium]|nr:methyltransferase domain-containing protein [Alphaproteobacteria bacterium]
MKPAAHLQAAIDILESLRAMPRPADVAAGQYFRTHRYIGAKDRSTISTMLYGVIRHHGRIGWWLAHLQAPDTSRTRLLTWLMTVRGREGDSIMKDCNGEKFAPAPCDEAEQKLLKNLKGRTAAHPHMPEATQHECPEWVYEKLHALYGDAAARELAAQMEEAPVDLRANPVKITREEAIEKLKAQGIPAVPCKLSPVGLRLSARMPLGNLDLFKQGAIEVQDEGSQIVALLLDANPGMRAADFCAGAGGKTLAIAAQMRNKGHVVACDVVDKRLKRAQERFRRAGLHNIKTQDLKDENDPWVRKHLGDFDRVLVDAPCTGTGTWRRNPDARWGRDIPALTELQEKQARILASAARLVKRGGRLVYATCSLLREENEEQIEKFLAAHADFALIPYAEIWPDALGTAPPPCKGDYLRLTPAQHGTDGFFCAVLVKK